MSIILGEIDLIEPSSKISIYFTIVSIFLEKVDLTQPSIFLGEVDLIQPSILLAEVDFTMIYKFLGKPVSEAFTMS
jgi:hypothetical protein